VLTPWRCCLSLSLSLSVTVAYELTLLVPQLRFCERCVATLGSVRNSRGPKAKRARGTGDERHSNVERLLQSGRRQDRLLGCAVPVRVSQAQTIFGMKTNILGLGAGWPLHVQLYCDRNQLILLTFD
jgi:hypothetical protein